MAWIELHDTLWMHPKNLALARTLRLDPCYSAAHLIKLWTWALTNRPSGELTGMSDREISEAAWWRKSPKIFVKSLKKCRWIDEKDGQVFLHNWPEYAGRLIAKREENRLRIRVFRATHVQRTVHEQYANSTRTVQGLPYRTVPNQGTPPVSPPLKKVGDTTQGKSVATVRPPSEASVRPPSVSPNGPDDAQAEGKAKVRPRKAAVVRPRIPERIEELDQEVVKRLVVGFSQTWSEREIRERIEEALAHEAARKYTDAYRYLRGWLRRDAERKAVTNGTYQGPLRKETYASTKSVIELQERKRREREPQGQPTPAVEDSPPAKGAGTGEV